MSLNRILVSFGSGGSLELVEELGWNLPGWITLALGLDDIFAWDAFGLVVGLGFMSVGLFDGFVGLVVDDGGFVVDVVVEGFVEVGGFVEVAGFCWNDSHVLH